MGKEKIFFKKRSDIYPISTQKSPGTKTSRGMYRQTERKAKSHSKEWIAADLYTIRYALSAFSHQTGDTLDKKHVVLFLSIVMV